MLVGPVGVVPGVVPGVPVGLVVVVPSGEPGEVVATGLPGRVIVKEPHAESTRAPTATHPSEVSRRYAGWREDDTWATLRPGPLR